MNNQLKEVYQSYWEGANKRPLVAARIPVKTRNIDKTAAWWQSVEAQLEQNEWNLQNTKLYGDAFPICTPDLGPDLFAACLGLELEFGQDTSWAIHNMALCDPQQYQKLEISPDNPYFRKIVELTEAFCEQSRGRFFVGIADLHPGADGLVALRSPQQLCFDAIDFPEFIPKASMDLFQEFKRIFEALFAITTASEQGSSNWMNVWHPAKQYVTSCDFSALISCDMFREQCLEELNAQLDYLDASIFHLDGPGALKHLDTLLALPKLKGVQWVYGAGQPTAAHWLDVLHKIQEAGKIVHIDAYPDDVAPLLKELKPQGLFLNLVGASHEEAREICGGILGRDAVR